MLDITALKDFMDLGGVFILALVLVWVLVKKLDSQEDKLIKILTLLTVLVKTNTKFNHIDKVLGEDSNKVDEVMNQTSKDNKSAKKQKR